MSRPASLWCSEVPARPQWAQTRVRDGMLLPSPRVPVRALWLAVRSGRSASERPAARAGRSLRGATRLHETLRADYCKPSYSRASHQVDWLRRAAGWRQVGFNVLPALIRL